MDFTIIAYALLSGILPALLWLWFWLKEDNLHPEPRSLLIGSFIAGMIVVVFAIFFKNVCTMPTPKFGKRMLFFIPFKYRPN
jgi:RsiW-degrading membrane proteinase PrsW (M82 family)